MIRINGAFIRLAFSIGIFSQFGCSALSRESAGLQEKSAVDISVAQEVYKQVNGIKLALDVYSKTDVQKAKARPAIVFFFGGGWNSGSPKQFEAHSRYLARKGMVAITADYRVRSRHQSQVIDSVADAKSAIRWIRANATKLGIDPNRIAAAGGSAGGHLAASTAFITEFDATNEDKTVSSIPNVLVLFNPALLLAKLPGSSFDDFRVRPAQQFLGAEPTKLSPAHHVKAGGPPAIIFHGEADTTVPFETVELFQKKMIEAKNDCQVLSYPGQGHGFFNREPYLGKTLASTEEFLKKLGWIQ